MGYTHYWTYQRNGSQAEWSNALARVHQILAETDVPLEVEYGDNLIRINGSGPCDGGVNHCGDWERWSPGQQPRCQTDPDGAQHEDFILYTILSELPENPPYNAENPGIYWDFCKTAQKSYDTPVTAILALLSTLAPSCIEVRSDGDMPNWERGIALARQATGLDIQAPASLLEPA